MKRYQFDHPGRYGARFIPIGALGGPSDELPGQSARYADRAVAQLPRTLALIEFALILSWDGRRDSNS
jgi:hypothetical protein